VSNEPIFVSQDFLLGGFAKKVPFFGVCSFWFRANPEIAAFFSEEIPPLFLVERWLLFLP